MIFVTIGSLFPFDRFVRRLDEIASERPQYAFFAQIGDGRYEPRHMPFARMLPAREFRAKVEASRLIVAHAGMGSVITAMQAEKPIVILPRKFDHGEHTTDHQAATARWLTGKPGVTVCLEDEELGPAVDRLAGGETAVERMSTTAPPDFLAKLRDYVIRA